MAQSYWRRERCVISDHIWHLNIKFNPGILKILKSWRKIVRFFNLKKRINKGALRACHYFVNLFERVHYKFTINLQWYGFAQTTKLDPTLMPLPTPRDILYIVTTKQRFKSMRKYHSSLFATNSIICCHPLHQVLKIYTTRIYYNTSPCSVNDERLSEETSCWYRGCRLPSVYIHLLKDGGETST